MTAALPALGRRAPGDQLPVDDRRNWRRLGGSDWRRLGELEEGGGLVEDGAEDLLDLVEVGLVADQRGRELDDRVAAVVGAAVEALVVERLGEEAAQQLLATPPR